MRRCALKLRRGLPIDTAISSRHAVDCAAIAGSANRECLTAAKKRPQGTVGSPSTFAQQHRQIAELALKYRLPLMFQGRVNAEAGGLMSYGQKFTDFYEHSATYVDKILKGAKPGHLPVEQPASFGLVVNLKTAKALGLTIRSRCFCARTR